MDAEIRFFCYYYFTEIFYFYCYSTMKLTRNISTSSSLESTTFDSPALGTAMIKATIYTYLVTEKVRLKQDL